MKAIAIAPNLLFIPRLFEMMEVPSELPKLSEVDINFYDERSGYKKTALSFMRERYKRALSFSWEECVQVSLVCNFTCLGSCSYCYAKRTIRRPNEIDLDVLLSFLHKLPRLQEVIIYGGEPLLYRRLSDLVSSLSCKVHLVTGLMVGEERFRLLESLLDKIPTLSVTVSLDPQTTPYHRKWSSVSTFDLVLNRFLWLSRNFGVRVGVRSTLVPDASIDLRRFVDSIWLFGPRLVNLSLQEGVEFSPQLLELLGQQLLTILDEDSCNYIAPLNRFYIDFDQPHQYINWFGECSQLFSSVTIDPYGRLRGCSEIPTINDNELVVDETTLDKLRVVRTRVSEDCILCDYLLLCGGGCYALGNTKSRCTWYKLHMKLALLLSYEGKLHYRNVTYGD